MKRFDADSLSVAIIRVAKGANDDRCLKLTSAIRDKSVEKSSLAGDVVCTFHY
jgi:hypothetical protein